MLLEVVSCLFWVAKTENNSKNFLMHRIFRAVVRGVKVKPPPFTKITKIAVCVGKCLNSTEHLKYPYTPLS